MSILIRNRAKHKAAKDYVRLYGSEDAAGGMPGHWEQGSGEYQEHFLSMREVMADIEGLGRDPEILAVVEKRSLKPAAVRHREHWPKLAAAAMLVVAILAGVGVWQSGYFGGLESGSNAVRYVTRVGEQKTVQLEDGTELTLNTNTQLLVDITEESRLVTLEQGQVYFDVWRDPQRPFVVSVGQRAVTVLGTEFSVLNEAGEFDLAVNEGSVALHQVGASIAGAENLELDGGPVELTLDEAHILTDGMQVSYRPQAGQLTVSKIDSSSRLFSWANGMIRFDGDNLSEVVRQLNRYSGRSIVIRDAETEELEVYMNINVETISDAFVALERILPVEIDKGFNEIELRARK